MSNYIKEINKYKAGNTIPQVDVNCGCDEFENLIRKLGVAFACEYFGHDYDSDFANETVEMLCKESGIKLPVKSKEQ
jgi:hypothetical protein